MKITAAYVNAKRLLEEREEELKKLEHFNFMGDEAIIPDWAWELYRKQTSVDSLMSAKAIIKAHDECYMKLTDEERARLAAVPSYQKDLRELKDIKDKYGVSWNDLRMMIGEYAYED